jgi:hypothetical protein
MSARPKSAGTSPAPRVVSPPGSSQGRSWNEPDRVPHRQWAHRLRADQSERPAGSGSLRGAAWRAPGVPNDHPDSRQIGTARCPKSDLCRPPRPRLRSRGAAASRTSARTVSRHGALPAKSWMYTDVTRSRWLSHSTSRACSSMCSVAHGPGRTWVGRARLADRLSSP